MVEGVANYLKSSIDKVRSLGSFVAQLMCNVINVNIKNKLQFPEDSWTARMKSELDELLELFEFVTSLFLFYF